MSLLNTLQNTLGDLMDGKVIIAITENGIARAECTGNELWDVQLLLEGEDVRCLAAAPQNSRFLYAGMQGKGVMRSDDSGKTWQPCGLAGKTIKSLAVNPRTPETIYAGTKPAYMYASKDGGRTWHELTGFRRIPWRWWWFSPAEKPNLAYVYSIAISPTDPNVILAGIEFGAVVRSDDGGLSWSGHCKGALRDCHMLKFHTHDGNWVYEVGGTGGGASYSSDEGKHWRKMKLGLAGHYGVACAADPFQPEIWYVSMALNPRKAFGDNEEAYLYRAGGRDGWQSIGWEPHPMKHTPVSLVTIQDAPGQLYAGLTNGVIWHTCDYGETWKKLPFRLKGIRNSLVIL